MHLGLEGTRRGALLSTHLRREGAADELVKCLVTAGQEERCLSIRATIAGREPVHSTADVGRPGWHLLGVHGGAGVTSLLRAGVSAVDARGAWPMEGAVVTAARRSAHGLEWARDAARQQASGGVPGDVHLAGLVVVADAPGRTPRRISRLLDLVCGAYPRVWEVPWIEEWRLAGHAEPLPLPPAARQLDEDMRALVGASTASAKE